MDALPGTPLEGKSKWVIPYIAHSLLPEHLFGHGLSVVNPGDAAVEVRLTIFPADESGEVRQTTFTLQAREKITRVLGGLDQFFPAFNQVGGVAEIEVVGDGAVIVGNLFLRLQPDGSLGDYMVTVPAQ